MLKSSKTQKRTWIIYISVLFTLLLWLTSKWYYQDWFYNPYKYVAKAASLTATVLMCWTILLSTRWSVLENYFQGLDKLYQVHRQTGKLAFFIILLHPLFLVLNRLPDMIYLLKGWWFQSTMGSFYLWGWNVGLTTLFIMIGLITLTLWIKIPYHQWKITHEFFGLVLTLVFVHILLVNSDIATYPFLRIWMYLCLITGLISFLYIRIFYRFWGPKYTYEITNLEQTGDILEMVLKPCCEKMNFKPSQFIYVIFHKPGISKEPHPYSIACGYNPEGEVKLGIKKIGDHTGKLNKLEIGDRATVYGPYGYFSNKFLDAKRNCIFVGGGIGITPFLGMWYVALHSGDQEKKGDVSEPLIRMHPELMKNWKSPLVNLFYVCRNREKASFHDDIKNEIEKSHYHGFKNFQQRGHLYQLYLTSEKGHITADYIANKVKGEVGEMNVFLCGPDKMVKQLTKQFQDKGVSSDQIVVEDFNLR